MDIEAQTHGGLPLEELASLGIEPREVLDLSTSLSPFPAHPAVLEAVRNCDLGHYPDPHSSAAKRAIARAAECALEQIVIGHGSVELLWSLVRILAAPERPLLMVAPTFSEAEDAARAHGLPVAHVWMRAERGFAIDPRAIDEAIAVKKPFAVYLCQPNNPTGAALAHDELAALIARNAPTPFIVDEAFLSLSEQHADAARPLPDNAIRVRSLTKDHCLAGLRLGYALCAPELARALETSRPPWMVSSPSQAAIIASMAHPEHVSAMRARLFELKAELVSALRERGYAPIASTTAFFLVATRDESADELRMRLLREHRILIRSGASFGLPDHIRLPACTQQAQTRLLAAL